MLTRKLNYMFWEPLYALCRFLSYCSNGKVVLLKMHVIIIIILTISLQKRLDPGVQWQSRHSVYQKPHDLARSDGKTTGWPACYSVAEGSQCELGRDGDWSGRCLVRCHSSTCAPSAAETTAPRWQCKYTEFSRMHHFFLLAFETHALFITRVSTSSPNGATAASVWLARLAKIFQCMSCSDFYQINIWSMGFSQRVCLSSFIP